jgi:hypothetical protein
MSKQEEGTCVVCRVPEVQVENEADDGFDDDMASVALSQVQKANEESQLISCICHYQEEQMCCQTIVKLSLKFVYIQTKIRLLIGQENEADDGFDDDMASVALSQVQKANEEWHISDTDIPWYVASQEEQKR